MGFISVSPDLAAGLRALAEALPAGTAVPVPREMLLAILEGAPAPAAPTNGTSTPNEPLLTVQEVATRFGLTPDWLYRH